MFPHRADVEKEMRAVSIVVFVYFVLKSFEKLFCHSVMSSFVHSYFVRVN